MVIMNDSFLELVCTGFFRSGHPDAFCKKFTCSGFQCCNYFLCHGVILLLYFSVKGVFLEDRIVFPPFHPVGGIFPVLCCYVP